MAGSNTAAQIGLTAFLAAKGATKAEATAFFISMRDTALPEGGFEEMWDHLNDSWDAFKIAQRAADHKRLGLG